MNDNTLENPAPAGEAVGERVIPQDNRPRPKPPAIRAGATPTGIVPSTFDETWRIATMVVRSGLAPRDLLTPERAMVAIMHGLELGLPPMTAIQRIAVINGRPAVWGDAVPAIAQRTGMLEAWDEGISGDGDDMTAFCKVTRRVNSELVISKTATFSVADAKKAGLWQTDAIVKRRSKGGGEYEKENDSPWYRFPKRMLQMRARVAFRDLFADAMCGLYIAEELVGGGSDAEMRDVTPSRAIHNPLEDDGPRPIIDKGNDPGPHPLDADEGPVKDLRADEPDGAVIEGDEAEKALTESAQNITGNITGLGDEAARALTKPTPISSKTGEREDDPDEIAHESATDTADYDPETGEVFDAPKPEPVAEQPKAAPAPAAKPTAGRRPRPVPPQARAAAAGEPKAEAAPKAAPTPKAAQEGNPAAGIVLADPIRRTAGEYLDYLRKWTAAFVGDPIALRDRYSTSDRTIRNALGTPLNDDEFKEAKAIALAAFKRLGGESSS